MSSLPYCWGVGLERTGNTSFCGTFEQLRDHKGASAMLWWDPPTLPMLNAGVAA